MKVTEERKALYDRGLHTWGIFRQIRMCIEEMAELTVELCKVDRLINGTTRDRVQEEIADAILTIEQMKWIFGEKEIEELEKKALIKLQVRINETLAHRKNGE